MKQQLGPGGILDLLTKDELSEAMGHNFDAAIRDLYRGVDYLSFTGVAGSQIFTIPYAPASGYAWSVKLLSAQIGNSTSLLTAYIGTSVNTVPAVGVATSVLTGDCVMQFGSNSLVIKDGQAITLYAPGSGGTVTNFQLRVLQVPTEMQGKL